MDFHMIFRVEAMNREHLFMEEVNRNLSLVAGGDSGIIGYPGGLICFFSLRIVFS
jgi:hypothetical protein